MEEGFMDGRIIGIAVVKAKDNESLNEITIVGIERKQRTPENLGKQNKQSILVSWEIRTLQGRVGDGGVSRMSPRNLPLGVTGC